MSEEEIHNQLSLEDQINLCSQALYFFSPMSYEKVVGFTNRKPTPGSMQPFTVLDFIQYLKNTEVLQNPNKYGLCISNILRKLASANLLKLIGITSPVFGEAYYYLRFRDTGFDKGKYWQAAAFGAEYIYHLFTPYIVHITGMNHEGDVVAGSGLLISSSKILTCAHVITDMKVNETLFAYGQEVKVLNCIPHDRVDVGIIEITNIDNFDEEQIAFAEPIDEVYLMGFPKIPDICEAGLTIQKGEVNNLDSTLFDGWKIFLFSAISRPGNSGGPIISHTGNIIGIVTAELFSNPKEGKRETTLPFYAGIPTSQITEALLELNDEFSLPN